MLFQYRSLEPLRSYCYASLSNASLPGHAAMSATQQDTAGTQLKAELAAARAAYVGANPLSRARMDRARAHLPGGNTRTVLHFDPFPLGVRHAAGARLVDLDGHEYTDFLGEFTAGLYGHNHPRIREAIVAALDQGINIGAPGEREAELASLLCARFASLELVRFTNSGTEANLMAIAAALVHTRRQRIIVFRRGYHGGVLSFSDQPSAVTVPHDFVLACYNDVEGTRALIREHAATLAAVLVEPMLGSGGCIPGRADFLAMLREETRRAGAVLIFDEVMTSRLGIGGRQSELAIRPDLTTLGKYLGGGMSFGAFGGTAQIMSRFDPGRPGALAHAGTFNNNALTMAAGVAALRDVYTPAAAVKLNARGDELRDRLNAIARHEQAPLRWTGLGSLMNVHCSHREVPDSGVDEEANDDLLELFFFDMLAAGIYLARRGFVALSLCIGDAETLQLERAVRGFITRRRPLFPAASP